ncbi:unnamed protein product [Merluccius merluccius]
MFCRLLAGLLLSCASPVLLTPASLVTPENLDPSQHTYRNDPNTYAMASSMPPDSYNSNPMPYDNTENSLMLRAGPGPGPGPGLGLGPQQPDICDFIMNDNQDGSTPPWICYCRFCKGGQGPKGDLGYRGLPGMCPWEPREKRTGQKGDDGEKGYMGPRGLTGSKGDRGFKGDKGDIGFIGPQGVQGPPGEDGSCPTSCVSLPGPPGTTGLPGSVGARGIPGPEGSSGARGPQGPKGDMGVPGVPGSDGGKGQQGEQGLCECADGEDGSPGVQGPRGLQGDPGPAGAPGAAGTPGEKGDMGDMGFQGPPGPCSPAIQSAFSAARTASFPRPEMPVPFRRVIFNRQQSFDPIMGIYTAPVNGTYVFSYFLTVMNKQLKVGLFHDFLPVVKTTAMTFAMASQQVVLHMAAGSRVWLQVKDRDSNGMYAGEDSSSTFSGYLLHPDDCMSPLRRDFVMPPTGAYVWGSETSTEAPTAPMTT